MKALEIVKNSYGLRVYCPKCQRQYNHENIRKCSHHESQYYKSIVHNNGSRRTLQHNTRDWEEALIRAIGFKKTVKIEPIYNASNNKDNTDDPQYISIRDAANMFIGFKKDLGVQPHQVRNLSRNYLSSIELYLRQFVEVMRENGYDVDCMPVSHINDDHVGLWYIKMIKLYSKGSWNAPIRVLRLWIEYMKDRKRVDMFNPFKDVKLVQTESTIDIIKKHEFEDVCEAVENKSPWAYLGGKSTRRKNRHKPYLVDAFRLALYTGLRREEFLTLTWDDIHYVNDEVGHIIITDNIKVERITGMAYKKKYVPIGVELSRLLNELGWQKLKGTDNYIIEPLRTTKTETLMNNCSKAFSHYYGQAFPGKPVKQMKILRKTYLTHLARTVGEDVVQFSSHSGTKVLEDHYFDKKLLVKGVGMKIFE